MYDDTALRRLLIELAASHPEHAAVIRAFTPLALARGKLLDAYALSRKTKPLDGFPMFRFEELPVCSEKSGAIASAVLEAVAEGFPGAREQVEAVRGALKPGSVPACARPASRMSRNRWSCSRRKTACRRMCWIW